MLPPYLFALHVPNVINHAFIKKLQNINFYQLLTNTEEVLKHV